MAKEKRPISGARNGGQLYAGGGGRPRKRVNEVITELEALGVTEVTNKDIVGAYTRMLNCTTTDLRKYALDESLPMLIRSVAKQMLSGKGQDMIDKMIDRAHGKAKDSVHVSGIPTPVAANIFTITYADPVQEDQSLLKKSPPRKPKV